MGMYMYFFMDTKLTSLVFENWEVDTPGKYTLSIIGTFLLAVAIEGLSVLRYFM
jgi:hypothetical protein